MATLRKIRGPARDFEQLCTHIVAERSEVSEFCLWRELRLVMPSTGQEFRIRVPCRAGIIHEIPSKVFMGTKFCSLKITLKNQVLKILSVNYSLWDAPLPFQSFREENI